MRTVSVECEFVAVPDDDRVVTRHPVDVFLDRLVHGDDHVRLWRESPFHPEHIVDDGARHVRLDHVSKDLMGVVHDRRSRDFLESDSYWKGVEVVTVDTAEREERGDA